MRLQCLAGATANGNGKPQLQKHYAELADFAELTGHIAFVSTTFFKQMQNSFILNDSARERDNAPSFAFIQLQISTASNKKK